MINRVQKTIQIHALIPPGSHVLVGVSGGADSVALARILHALCRSLKFRITLAHLNHSLRGIESDGDEGFVESFARVLRVPFIHERCEVRKWARKKGISLEMAAREMRHRFFRQALNKVSADAVALAHTADDQAETVLLKLMRGAGFQGLSGMRPRTSIAGMTIIRPLLDIPRQRIISYFKKTEQKWREDSTNKEVCFMRNRVRHELLPFLEERFNPQVKEALAQTATLFGDEEEWKSRLIAPLYAACTTSDARDALAVDALREQPIAVQRRILLNWLREHKIDLERVDYTLIRQLLELVQTKRGTQHVSLPGGVTAVRSYAVLSVVEHDAPQPAPFRQAIVVPGETILPGTGLRVTATWSRGAIKRRSRIGSFPVEASLSAEAIGRSRLFLRSWSAGDRMKPLGIKGSKKIQDIFVDQKVPKLKRIETPLLECKKEIVWLPGYQVASRWEVMGSLDRSLHVRIDIV